MNTYSLTHAPVAKAQMLIRKPVAQVFEAFVNPAITSKFWFTKGSGRLEPGKRIRWDWEMYGSSAEVNVQVVEPNRRILIEWSASGAPTTVEWIFTPRPDSTTLVSITESGFSGDGDEITQRALSSTGGFTLVLAGLKGFLEHNITLNLVPDRFPDARVKGAVVTQPNLELINSFFDAYGKRDFDGLHRVLAENAQWTALGRHPLSGVRKGFDQVIAFFDAMGAVMGKSNVRAEKLVVGADDRYVVECQHVWTNRKDGRNLDHLVCVLWKFENGKIVEGRHFFSDPKAADDFFNHAATEE